MNKHLTHTTLTHTSVDHTNTTRHLLHVDSSNKYTHANIVKCSTADDNFVIIVIRHYDTNWVKLNKLGRVQATEFKVCEQVANLSVKTCQTPGHRQVSDKIDEMEFALIHLMYIDFYVTVPFILCWRNYVSQLSVCLSVTEFILKIYEHCIFKTAWAISTNLQTCCK